MDGRAAQRETDANDPGCGKTRNKITRGHSCLGAIRKGSPLSARADIYFPLYVPPLHRAAQSVDHLLKGIGVFGRVLEPSQEVEWLSKFSAVMQASRYGRQVFHTNSNVPRLLLEDGSAFILR